MSRESRAQETRDFAAEIASIWDPTLSQPLVASAPELLERCESAIACLRHTHDRLIGQPEYETLCITINAEVREIRAAIAKAGA